MRGSEMAIYIRSILTTEIETSCLSNYIPLSRDLISHPSSHSLLIIRLDSPQACKVAPWTVRCGPRSSCTGSRYQLCLVFLIEPQHIRTPPSSHQRDNNSSSGRKKDLPRHKIAISCSYPSFTRGLSLVPVPANLSLLRQSFLTTHSYVSSTID